MEDGDLASKYPPDVIARFLGCEPGFGPDVAVELHNGMIQFAKATGYGEDRAREWLLRKIRSYTSPPSVG